MSNVSAGAVMTLVIPLALLVVVLALAALGHRGPMRSRRAVRGDRANDRGDVTPRR